VGAAPPPAQPRPGRSRPPLAGLAAAGALAGLLAAGLLVAGGRAGQDRGEVAFGPPAPPPQTWQALAAGTPAPPLRLATLDGGTVDLAALRGRPVVVNFCASWCVPCRQEFPLLKAVQSAHAGAGLAVVGVVVNSPVTDARAFARDMGAGWPMGVDADHRAIGAWGVLGLPQTFFLRRDGTLASRQPGQLSRASLDAQVAAIVR
jgi:cytochrome c biogenesis protein CcmG, thiol:disulfide interchange protein DsbE